MNGYQQALLRSLLKCDLLALEISGMPDGLRFAGVVGLRSVEESLGFLGFLGTSHEAVGFWILGDPFLRQLALTISRNHLSLTDKSWTSSLNILLGHPLRFLLSR